MLTGCKAGIYLARAGRNLPCHLNQEQGMSPGQGISETKNLVYLHGLSGIQQPAPQNFPVATGP